MPVASVPRLSSKNHSVAEYTERNPTSTYHEKSPDTPRTRNTYTFLPQRPFATPSPPSLAHPFRNATDSNLNISSQSRPRIRTYIYAERLLGTYSYTFSIDSGFWWLSAQRLSVWISKASLIRANIFWRKFHFLESPPCRYKRIQSKYTSELPVLRVSVQSSPPKVSVPYWQVLHALSAYGFFFVFFFVLSTKIAREYFHNIVTAPNPFESTVARVLYFFLGTQPKWISCTADE